jgi:tRNA-Thr(GGU) m(6)t(6)A37 methyltransferase TsaA
MTLADHTISPIGYVVSPYRQKFAIPRQPGLATAAKGDIVLQGAYNHPDVVRGIEQYSHLWLQFIFHQTQAQGWQPLVRPPRLGGNKKMGVFATRSTFRPNALGLSVVKLDGVSYQQKQVKIHISGLDLVDGTPIVDIKPYIKFADAIETAVSGFAQDAPEQLTVIFSKEALLRLTNLKPDYPHLQQLIEQVVAQDPRPAYKRKKHDTKLYGMNLYHFNIKWQLNEQNQAIILAINELSVDKN